MMSDDLVTTAVSERRKFLFALAIFVAVLTGWMFGRNAERKNSLAEAAATPLPTAPVPASVPGCSIWFIGSSSIANWTTMSADLSPWEARNRGMGGATMEEITRRFRNEPSGATPGAIVYYAGENDIAFGNTPSQALDKLKSFIAAKRGRYGDMKMLILALKPSPTRWDQRPQQIEFDRRVRALVANQRDLSFLDMSQSLIVDGRPGLYYREDGIHLNKDGYRVWARMISQTLPTLIPEAAKQCALPDSKA